MAVSITFGKPPGVYVSEGASGLIPSEFARQDRLYLLGSGSGPVDEADPDLFATPTQIVSLDDAQARFGVGSASTTGLSIGLIFDIFAAAIVQFVRVPVGQTLTVTPTHLGNHDTVTITVSGTVFTYAIDHEVDTSIATFITRLVAAINDESSSINGLVVAYGATATDFSLRWVDPSAPGTVTITDSGATTITLAVDATASSPSLADYLWTIENAFDRDEHSQGFLAAPEAFATLEAADRTALRIAMEAHCSEEGFDWCALIDAGDTDIATAASESANYFSPQGHSTLPFYPYFVTLSGGEVPQSCAVAATAFRRWREQGFIEPPAGGQYPVPVAGLTRRVTFNEFSAHYESLNIARTLPTIGTVIYGSRTRATDPRFLWLNGRIIANTIIGTLRRPALWNSVVFSAIDGRGALFLRIRQTIENLLYRLWQAGGLYGANPSAAYLVNVSASNNPDFDIQNGAVNADVYVAISPTLEKLGINLIRTSIGQVQAVASSLDNSRSNL